RSTSTWWSCLVRSFIPHRAHASIGVLVPLALATACLIEGSPAADVADIPDSNRKAMSIEHASGETTCIMELDANEVVVSSAILRTARKLMDGKVFE
ncbi:MAG: PrpF domain-containing protein, partial [Woeseiaceae bacterium]|nr:PrpF domain-containing protein [Woeseiaceae bacterium]